MCIRDSPISFEHNARPHCIRGKKLVFSPPMTDRHVLSGTPTDDRPKNRLATEASPYLRQHGENPVDWFPWGEEALRRAAAEDKPILLSIGYSACHWCHVMERESFEDPAIAAKMNAGFVCVKVDREERPDLDQIYHCLLYTSPSPRDRTRSRMPSSA